MCHLRQEQRSINLVLNVFSAVPARAERRNKEVVVTTCEDVAGG
jgi:hypothetical protein